MSKLQRLKDRVLQNSSVRREYEALESEFKLIGKLLKMRKSTGLTQYDLASHVVSNRNNI